MGHRAVAREDGVSSRGVSLKAKPRTQPGKGTHNEQRVCLPRSCRGPWAPADGPYAPPPPTKDCLFPALGAAVSLIGTDRAPAAQGPARAPCRSHGLPCSREGRPSSLIIGAAVSGAGPDLIRLGGAPLSTDPAANWLAGDLLGLESPQPSHTLLCFPIFKRKGRHIPGPSLSFAS